MPTENQGAFNGQSKRAVPAIKPNLLGQICFSLETWLIWRGCTLGPWYWLGDAALHKAFGASLYCPDLLGLSFLFPVIWFLIITRNYRNFILYCFYLPLFPIVIVFITVIAIPQLLTKASRLYNKTTHPIAGAILLIVIIGELVALLAFTDHTTITILAYTAPVTLNFLLFVGLRWASDPLAPFINTLKLLDRLRPIVDSGKHNEESLKMFETAAGWVKLKLAQIAKRTIIPLFTGALLAAFALIVVAYGTVTYSAQSLAYPPYDNLPANYLHCLAVSMSVMTTSPIPNINPQHGLGVFLYASQLFSTFMLVTVFLSLFSLSLGVLSEDQKKQMDEMSQDLLDWIQQLRAKHSPVAAPSAKVHQSESNVIDLPAPLVEDATFDSKHSDIPAPESIPVLNGNASGSSPICQTVSKIGNTSNSAIVFRDIVFGLRNDLKIAGKDFNKAKILLHAAHGKLGPIVKNLPSCCIVIVNSSLKKVKKLAERKQEFAPQPEYVFWIILEKELDTLDSLSEWVFSTGGIEGRSVVKCLPESDSYGILNTCCSFGAECIS